MHQIFENLLKFYYYAKIDKLDWDQFRHDYEVYK